MTKLRHERLCSHDITETERKIPNGETHEDYRGYRIIVGPTGDGWWARISQSADNPRSRRMGVR